VPLSVARCVLGDPFGGDLAMRAVLRGLWIDRPVGLLLLIAATVAFRQLVLPVATDPDAPDTLVGAAQLVWLALCLLLPAALGLLLLRLLQRVRGVRGA
jgi:hypothetical protein